MTRKAKVKPKKQEQEPPSFATYKAVAEHLYKVLLLVFRKSILCHGNRFFPLQHGRESLLMAVQEGRCDVLAELLRLELAISSEQVSLQF